ncbi:MAG: pyridoxamine 5'-phosphate oxidase [Acidimicrobiia bacterium]|nr:pyridoxamine 5'-phosphate oxidase [Acidimicrobiia bacterium]
MEPTSSRPYMPGYGTAPPEEGTGLLPWSWAEERLARSHDYWVATTWADGRPHLAPVWGVWMGDALWFSSGRRSRKARNLEAEPRCAVSTDDAQEPVVLNGAATRVVDLRAIQGFLETCNAKYGSGYGIEFLDPEVNATFQVLPRTVVGLTEADFGGSPTRWAFPSVLEGH